MKTNNAYATISALSLMMLPTDRPTEIKDMKLPQRARRNVLSSFPASLGTSSFLSAAQFALFGDFFLQHYFFSHLQTSFVCACGQRCVVKLRKSFHTYDSISFLKFLLIFETFAPSCFPLSSLLFFCFFVFLCAGMNKENLFTFADIVVQLHEKERTFKTKRGIRNNRETIQFSSCHVARS